MGLKKDKEKAIRFLQEQVHKCKMLVVGDIMLDQYLYGEVERISPEAPVPVNRIEKQVDVPGGAANVANNLARLGCKTYLAGVIGRDFRSEILKELLQRENIGFNGLLEGRKDTIAKTRIIGGHQQMVRLDFEDTEPINEDVENRLLEYIHKILLNGINGIILSDYKKGVCTKRLCQTTISYAHCFGIPVFVDPKQKNWKTYAGADFITPNLKELGEVLGIRLHNTDEAVLRAAQYTSKKYDIGYIVATRSEKGVSVFGQGLIAHMPALSQDVFDVSGAGDTIISVLAAALAGNLSLDTAAELANIAAGIGVGKVGTYAVSSKEIISVISKIYD